MNGKSGMEVTVSATERAKSTKEPWLYGLKGSGEKQRRGWVLSQ